MEFRPQLCLQSSQPELNINLSVFINVFQVQCNMEHEWLPKESLEGTLANPSLRFTIIIAFSWPIKALIESKLSQNIILKKEIFVTRL